MPPLDSGADLDNKTIQVHRFPHDDDSPECAYRKFHGLGAARDQNQRNALSELDDLSTLIPPRVRAPGPQVSATTTSTSPASTAD